ncbi:hypothetical protein BH24ACT10_BH24ACT10_00890 [soil metagenome]
MDHFALPPVPDTTLRILLVEDSRADADLLVAMLEDELPHAVVEVSASVAEAMPLLAGPLDIAITDLSLPDAEGLQALLAILAARPDIAVVVLTGRQDRQLALQALSAGAEDYLVKGAHDARGVATAVLYAAQRRTAEQKAHRYERLALSLLDAMEASTCAVDEDGKIIAVNRAWRDFAEANGGQADPTGVGADYFQVCAAAFGPGAELAREVVHGLRQLLVGDIDRFERDYPCHGPDSERWFSVRMNRLPEAGAVVSHVDVTAATVSQQALTHLSLHDPLTDLPNRHLLDDRLTQALAWTARQGGSVAVAFVDIDHFKRVNDSLGHAAGDELLCVLAARLRPLLRSADTLARFAGDEFVVVWPGIATAEEAEQLMARLTAALDAPFVLTAATVTVTVSVGLAVGRSPQTAEDLLLAADAAMYDAKSRGRGQTRTYTDELRRSSDARLRTEADLREGLRLGQFVLHYQPVVDLRRRQVTGVEALVRWAHPDGLRPPDAFIPVAEAAGLIVPLGTWVLEQACRQGVAWSRQGLDLVVAVNFSARQISHPHVITSIEEVLAATGMDADRLLVEVTESTVMEDAELAEVALKRIVDLGASVAIDDFGTGYSSLLYLKRYPIAALKVVRHFVAGMGLNDEDDAIVASVVALARAVGAVCIAEGVETAEQHAALQALGCDFVQGYLFGRPVPAAELPALIERCQALLAVPVLRSSGRRTAPLPVDRALQARVEELHHKGNSLHTIAAVLNAERRLQPSGRRWHSVSVGKVVAQLSG